MPEQVLVAAVDEVGALAADCSVVDEAAVEGRVVVPVSVVAEQACSHPIRKVENYFSSVVPAE